MRISPERKQNLIAGGVLAAVGVFAIVHASAFDIGTMMRVGPAVMPALLGLVLVLLGVFVSLEQETGNAAPALAGLGPLASIFGSILAFALLIERAGLVPATFTLVAIVGLAETRFRPVTLLLVAIALSLFSVLVFIEALGVPLVPFAAFG